MPDTIQTRSGGLSGLRREAEVLRRELDNLAVSSDAFATKLERLAAVQTELANKTDSFKVQAQQVAALRAELDGLSESERQRSTDRLADQQTTEAERARLRVEQTQAEVASLATLQAAQAEQTASEDRLAKARVQTTQAALEAFSALSSGTRSSSRDFAGAQQALFLFNQALAIREVIVATQRELATIAATYAAAPPVAAALSARAIAGGALRVATIGAQTVPKFAQGGLLSGPSHRSGGIALVDRHSGAITAEAEGGELILTRRVSQNPTLLALASRVNELAGGARLSPLVPRTHLATGGSVPSSGATDTVLAAIEALANRPVVVSVEEITNVANRVQVLESATRF